MDDETIPRIYPEITSLRGEFLEWAALIESILGEVLVSYMGVTRDEEFRTFFVGEMTLGRLVEKVCALALKDQEIAPSFPDLATRLGTLVKARNTLAHSAVIPQSEAWTADGWTIGGLTRSGYRTESFTIEQLRARVDDARDLQGRVWELWERVAGHELPDSTC